MSTTRPCDHPHTADNTYHPSDRKPQCRRCYLNKVKKAQQKANASWHAQDPRFLLPTERDLLSFHKRHAQHDTDNCLLWTGPQEKGYGIFPYKGVKPHAHVVAYLWAYGWPEAESHIHHKCLNKLCVNPEHLQALTPAGHSETHHSLQGRPHAFCSKGHPLVGENLRITTQGGRQCRICTRAYQNERYRQQVLDSGKVPGQSGQTMPTCKNGHTWTPATTKRLNTKNGPRRVCRVCVRASYARKVGHEPRPYRKRQAT